MKYLFQAIVISGFYALFFWSCNSNFSNREMIDLLAATQKAGSSYKNSFSSESKLKYYDSIRRSANSETSDLASFSVGSAYLELGEEQQAISTWEKLLTRLNRLETDKRKVLLKYLAIANIRLGERTNCIIDHTSQSCIFPIKTAGIHHDQSGSRRAIEIYQQLLSEDPDDLESRWLLNIAYMTTGGYPEMVPENFLIKGLDKDTTNLVKPFVDMAHNLSLGIENMAGGSIVDDFNNDGYLDLVTSSWGLQDGMHFCRNKGNGSFGDASVSSGLAALTGGLNIQQTDYNNDGWKDIFVLRGAWKGAYGKEPNSLLRNNGDGSFTDVTRQSGLLSFHPTQTATWADFNNDGWLDVFIGNETSASNEIHPCELFINNTNGTFTDISTAAGCDIIDFVKGVTSGDYNNDGLPDIFISTMSGHKRLLRNEYDTKGSLHFKDVTAEAGFDKNTTRTFPTWFWDYNNDGWLDIMVSSYEFSKPLGYYPASEALGFPVKNEGRIFLYKNNQNGSFTEISEQTGLNKIVFAMGANFGDINNDGYLDMYFGTGNPPYQSLVPNKMFLNINGERFADVTTGARVGNLQKGHGVSFADLDNDGDQDIHIDMGGAFKGDAYQSSLYINPGQNDNNRINIQLIGTNCNVAAIGAKLRVIFHENGVRRMVYREVNSGGSFGSNPLVQHIGIGQSKMVDSIEVVWPGNRKPQIMQSIPAGDYIVVTEGKAAVEKRKLNSVDWLANRLLKISCAPE